MVKKNACIFISGYGSNLKSLIQNSRNHNFPVNIKLVVSDNKNANGLLHAKKNSIPYLVINTKKKNHEITTLNNIKKYNISIICLAGYMKIISKKFIKSLEKNNKYTSLFITKFKGLNTYKRVLTNNEKENWLHCTLC